MSNTDEQHDKQKKPADGLQDTSSRRFFLKGLSIGAAAVSASLVTGCVATVDGATSEDLRLSWQEFFKKNYRLMSQEEKDQTVSRLERLAALRDGTVLQIGSEPPIEQVLPAYVFHDPDFHRVVIIGEGVAVGALIMCLSFIMVDLGGPLQAWHLIPGIGLFNFPSSILAWDVLVLNGYLKEFYFPTHHSIAAIYLFFGLDGHNSLVPWIWTSVCVNLAATLVLAFNPGKNNPKVLLPACVFLFVAIWMEKGIGLIVPGLIPSPLGEVVDYLPTWVELCVTLGIMALGITVVSWLVRTALIIEERYGK